MDKRRKNLEAKIEEKKEELLRLVKEGKITPETFKAMVEAEKHPSTVNTIDLSDCVRGRKLEIGVVSDTHLNSKYARLDLLHTVYRHFREMNVPYVLHCGNLVGKFVLKKHDVENSLFADYGDIIKMLPQWMPNIGVNTYFIGGRNEESYIGKKINVLDSSTKKWISVEIDLIKDIHEKREDLIFLGWNNALVKVSDKVVVSLASPSTGSRKPYTTSHPVEKVMESYGGGEKPSVQLLGYYHKRWEGMVRDVPTLQIGTLQNHTPQARAKQEPAHTLGAVVLQFEFNKDGSLAANGFQSKDIPFYE